MPQPHDRIALVTGAGGGVGRALVPLLVADGWRVVVAGRGLPALHDTLALCGDPFADIHDRALALTADVARPDAVAELFDVVRARFGRLDLLVQAAGVGAGQAEGRRAGATLAPQDQPLPAWHAALETRLTGSLLCMQQAFRMMSVQAPAGGRIVLLARGADAGGEPLPLAEATTRQGLQGLAQACALAGRRLGIAVGLVELQAAVPDPATSWPGRMPLQAGAGGPPLAVQHAAQAVLQLASLPLQANVLGMTLAGTARPAHQQAGGMPPPEPGTAAGAAG